MSESQQPVVAPAPNEYEAAAIAVAIADYLAAQRRAAPATLSVERRWALAGRLASQGLPISRPPGTVLTWAAAARLARTRR